MSGPFGLFNMIVPKKMGLHSIIIHDNRRRSYVYTLVYKALQISTLAPQSPFQGYSHKDRENGDFHRNPRAARRQAFSAYMTYVRPDSASSGRPIMPPAIFKVRSIAYNWWWFQRSLLAARVLHLLPNHGRPMLPAFLSFCSFRILLINTGITTTHATLLSPWTIECMCGSRPLHALAAY